jgi:hypothetical protein
VTDPMRDTDELPRARRRRRRRRGWIRNAAVAIVVAFVVVAVLGGEDEEPLTPASAPDPTPSASPSAAADKQPTRRQRLRRQYARRDARVCRAAVTVIADLMDTAGGEGATNDDLRGYATTLRKLAGRASDRDGGVLLAYSMTGIANDLDGIILADAVTSDAEAALNANIADVAVSCDEAADAWPRAS